MSYGFYRDREVKLPHKPLPLSVFLIVEKAIRASWQRLKSRTNPRINIKTAHEDDVTLDLYEVIYDEVFDQGVVDGFDKERFTVVTRETKVRNYNGDNPDKMPDLLVGIAGRNDIYLNSQDWLFIECKPVDANHTVGVHYGSKGIARFIRSDYAWAMTSALMVGYCSPGYSICPKLIESLKSRSKEFRVLGEPVECTCLPRGNGVYKTEHERDFDYVETGFRAPPIRLRHLWLDRN